jgi:hypothetical protein
VRWLLAGLLLLWLVPTLVNQLLTGDFWLWGVPDPLPPLLYFAGPPVVLAAVAMLALARTRLPRTDRALLGAGLALLGLVVLHLLLSGRTWLWVLPDLMPPLLFALLPVALLVTLGVLVLRHRGPGRRAGRATAVLAAAALALGAGQAGLNPAFASDAGPIPPGALHVVSWDTLHWDAGDPDRFYRYLTDRHADVYLLQDYPDTPLAARLVAAFPGYRFATAGDLLTISRYPIVASAPLLTNPTPPAGTANIDFIQRWRYGALRTDLLVGGRVLSVYNVHFYDRFALNVLPLTPAFFRNVRGLDEGRRQQFDGVLADVRAATDPVLVSGNLNVLPNAGDLRRFAALADAGAGRSPYPSTLTFFGLPLWRVDWTFTSPGMRVHRYDLRPAEGLSSHALQDFVISPPD